MRFGRGWPVSGCLLEPRPSPCSELCCSKGWPGLCTCVVRCCYTLSKTRSAANLWTWGLDPFRTTNRRHRFGQQSRDVLQGTASRLLLTPWCKIRTPCHYQLSACLLLLTTYGSKVSLCQGAQVIPSIPAILAHHSAHLNQR